MFRVLVVGVFLIWFGWLSCMLSLCWWLGVLVVGCVGCWDVCGAYNDPTNPQ